MPPLLRQGTGSARGFTLIEILVVLMLMGLLLTLSAPALERLYGQLIERSRMQELQSAILGLPLGAYALGEEGTLAQLAAAHIEIPEGWSLGNAETIYIRSNGLCSGGTLQLITPAGERVLQLDPPFCAVREAP